MSFMKEGKYDETQTASVKAVLPHFDQALAKDLSYYRSNDRSTVEWWAARKSFACLVLPKEACDKVLAEGACAKRVLDGMEVIASSSEAGKKLVAKAQKAAIQAWPRW